MTPHMEAIAFRIWQVAEPKGWDLTARDIADEIGVNHRWVTRIATAKGWNTRLRASMADTSSFWASSAHRLGPVEMGWDQ